MRLALLVSTEMVPAKAQVISQVCRASSPLPGSCEHDGQKARKWGNSRQQIGFSSSCKVPTLHLYFTFLSLSCGREIKQQRMGSPSVLRGVRADVVEARVVLAQVKRRLEGAPRPPTSERQHLSLEVCVPRAVERHPPAEGSSVWGAGGFQLCSELPVGQEGALPR